MFNFSRSEIRVIIFLVLLLLVGSGITLYRRYQTNQSVDIVSVIEKSTRATKRPAGNPQAQEATFESTSKTEDEIETRKDSAPKIDINSANAYELEGLPGIGPVLARRIIQYREKHGEFKTISELNKVSGVGDKKQEAIRGYIYIK